MRLGRVAFILLAIYLVFLGGSAYYHLIFPVRIAHHVLITLLLTLWLVGRLRKGKGLPDTPLNLPIAILATVWIVSAAASLDPRMAFEHLWLQLTHVLFFFVLADWIQRGRQRQLMEAQFMVAAIIILLSGLEVASWYFGLGIIPGTAVGWVDVIGPGAWLPLKPPTLSLAMNISTLLAGYVAPLVVISTAWAMTARREYRKALWIMAAALLVVLILTFSRGGLISLAAAVFTWGALRLSQSSRSSRLLPARTLLAAAGIVGVAALTVFVILSLTTSSKTFGDAGRVDMWRSAVNMLRDDPVTGVGPGLFGRAFRDYRDPALAQDKLAAAHNLYLNLTAEIGVPGLLVSLWMGIVFIRAWMANWKGSDSAPRKLRLEAALAALIGLGAHSLVEVFTITPIVLLILLLAAYCITPLKARLIGEEVVQRRSSRLSQASGFTALVVVLGYGAWFFQLDRAYAHYLNSLSKPQNAPVEIQIATDLDPGLKLYPLQAAYQRANAFIDEQKEEQKEELQSAIREYRETVNIEPSWDTGWINLAALEIERGNQTTALEYLAKARQINQRSPASYWWAALAELLKAAPDETIIDAYVIAIESSGYLPLADVWWETPLRREAVSRYLEAAPVDIKYRVLVEHMHSQSMSIRQIIPAQPGTAEEWWIVGEQALTRQNDAHQAAAFFTEAINRAPSNGDYYASRARAELAAHPTAAERDLRIAELLGTYAEYPNAIRAQMAAANDEAHRLRAEALPPRRVGQEFAGVLFGRIANFDLLPTMRLPGPGREAMQPWYELAEQYEATGDMQAALNVYDAILDYAPDEKEAATRRQALGMQVIDPG